MLAATRSYRGKASRVGRGMGKEVGVGKEGVNRKCAQNVPVKQAELHPPPQTSAFSVLPQMPKAGLFLQGKTARSSSLRKPSLRERWGCPNFWEETEILRCPSSENICKKPQICDHRPGHSKGPSLGREASKM